VPFRVTRPSSKSTQGADAHVDTPAAIASMISSLKMLSSPHAHEKPQCVHERDYRVRRAAARPAQPLRDTPPRSVRAGRRALRALMGSRIADAAATRDATSD